MGKLNFMIKMIISNTLLEKGENLVLSAKITGIKYKPYLCKDLKIYEVKKFGEALEKDASFIIDFGNNQQFAISWWVSAKRTRSYPYARVYNTLKFPGKKVTIIPIYKDEGFDGDRDFLQWDTISLMSLLGVYTIIGYYINAEINTNYENKITNQRFDIDFLKRQMKNLLVYQSDPLHWNLSQIDSVGSITEKALKSYSIISNNLKVKMHSVDSAERRIKELQKGKDNFMNLSRKLAKDAQNREEQTTQPKERVSGTKARLTIKNYLGGYYYFTSDEAEFDKKVISLYECKHSKNSVIPSIDDIKDGLIKMVLFTNLVDVTLKGKIYPHRSILKLTSNMKSKSDVRSTKIELIELLEKEASVNGFEIEIS